MCGVNWQSAGKHGTLKRDFGHLPVDIALVNGGNRKMLDGVC